MEYLIGMILALGVFGFAVAAGFDRERAFYPTVAIVVASYYVLFAAMGGSGGTLIEEIAVAGGFLLLALVGYKKSALLVALVIFGHGIFDMVHHSWIENPGMPAWWPGFCMTFDVVLGGVLAVRLLRTRLAKG